MHIKFRSFYQTNPGWLEQTLRAVSYPDSPEYGNYMNFNEIAEYVHGRPESVQALVDTLDEVGITSERIDFTLGRDFAVVRMPVEAAERLFAADFYVFQHQELAGQRVLKSLDYTLPQSLVGHLDFISGISEFPRPNLVCPKLTQSENSLGTNPQTIDKDYNISGYVSTSPQNSQAIAGFLKQYFSPSDLRQFQQTYDLPSDPIAKVVGENQPDDPGIEADLDVEYITATGRNVTTWFISISKLANKGQEDFLSWIVGQVNTTDSPWVHSLSYGDYENSIPTDYQTRCDDEFKKFGISGRTILFASGDSGVACKKSKFQPMWPACSPSITAVGGTVSLEQVWEEGGGGFSNTFGTPDYQKEAVQAFLNSGKAPPTKDFNSSGRAYPDVSAFSVNFEIIYAEGREEVGGTSCAAPTFAGIVSILNDVRMKNGKSTLGFLNPLLYQTLKGRGFFDITKGKNDGGALFCKGFEAIQGWDPASGWGSPNFGLLKELVLQA